jgi:hypothetical protein
MADLRMMIDDEPRRRSSSDTLQALTVDWRGDAVEHQRLQFLPSCDLFHHDPLGM